MTKSLTVRDLPVEVVDELAARAAGSGRSLQEYVRLHLIELTARPTPESWTMRVRAHKAAAGKRVSMDDVLDDLDLDRR